MPNMATTTTIDPVKTNISIQFITPISTDRHAGSATPFRQSTSTPPPSPSVSEPAWIDVLAIVAIIIIITALFILFWFPNKRGLNARTEHNDIRMRSLPQEQVSA
jgi:hypothetical protein